MLDTITFWHAIILLVSGIVAGFINLLAGGGSFLTIPALMLMGLPADIANATNRVGVMIQALAGIRGFDKHGALPRKAIVSLLVPCVSGALVGSLAASYIPVNYLKPIILICLSAMAVWMVAKPSALTPPADSQPLSPWQSPKGLLAVFAAGVYGGFLQAGVGFMLIAALVGVLHFNLLQANALKMVSTAFFTLMALAVFIVRDQVVWIPGLLLGLGSLIGVKLGVNFAMRVNQQVLRWFLLIAVIAVCLVLGLSD